MKLIITSDITKQHITVKSKACEPRK